MSASVQLRAAQFAVVIPAFNEANTIHEVLGRVAAAPYDKQIIVVNDGSADDTETAIQNAFAAWSGHERVVQFDTISHAVNRGKGAAIRTGLARVQAPIVLVQDADLEYFPEDYPLLIEPILAGCMDAVYGSRYLSPARPLPWTRHRVCVCLLNWLVRLMFGQSLTDEATCYKVFRTDLLKLLDLKCERFEFCPEVTAKLCRIGVRIHEVPIRYSPRTLAEGKKIRWTDGVEAIATLFRWRLSSVSHLSDAWKDNGRLPKEFN